jgi:2-methylcitrate dehydratase
MPQQYEPERIRRADVQNLLRNTIVRPSTEYSERFPDEMPCRLTITLHDGTVLVKGKRDYEGFHTNPMSWEWVKAKFDGLSASYADAELRGAIAEAVEDLESIEVQDLTDLLAQVERVDS